jgi:hypothetical protein
MGLGDRRHQCRHPVRLRHLLARVYGVIMGGWASNSKYPFLGALRSAAQMVSYEVSIGFVIVTVLLCVGSLNLTDIVMAQNTGIGTRMGCRARCSTGTGCRCSRCSSCSSSRRWPKRTARHSICPEAESELVAGFMVEYGSTPYMMFMLGEYAAIVLMCALTTILFLGGWLPPVDVPPSWVPGIVWFVLKVWRVLHVLHGEGLRAALPLRPADAAWLESVPAAFAGHAGDRGIRAQADGDRAVMPTTFFHPALCETERRLHARSSRKIASCSRSSSARSFCRCAISSSPRRR